MHFDNAPGPVFRPPSEANSYILRVTLGCSHNQCSFCSMYKGVVFYKRSMAEIFHLIEQTAAHYPEIQRIFLADGNALCLDTEDLVTILKKLREVFPKLQRVTAYGAPQDILRKSVDELAQLKEHGLAMIYLGLESGSDMILEKVRKGVTSAEMIEAAEKVRAVNMKLSVMIILGLGGQEHTEEHIIGTAKTASAMSPNYLSALSLMIHPGTELRRQAENGEFTPLSPYQMVSELSLLLKNLAPKTPVIFRASHPSNFAIFAGTLPKDQERLIHETEQAAAKLVDYQTPDFNDHGRF